MRRFYYDTTTQTGNSVLVPLNSYDIGATIVLPDTVFHHWCRVLRAQIGDEAVLFDGFGGEYVCQLRTIQNKTASVTLNGFDAKDHAPKVQTLVAMVMSRGDRMDYAIQKATELGVTAIQLLTSQHGEVHLKAAQIPKKLLHWQQVALAACEQCGLNRPPLILAPVSINDWLTNNTLQQTSERQPSAIDSHQVSDMIAPLLADSYYQAINALPQLRLLLAVPKALSTLSATVEGFNSSDQDRQLNEQPSINLCHPQNQPLLWQHIQKVCQTSAAYIQLLIGPEGGFSQEEHELAVATGFLPWQLGERVLRAETAPVVALATLHSLSMISC